MNVFNKTAGMNGSKFVFDNFFDIFFISCHLFNTVLNKNKEYTD